MYYHTVGVCREGLIEDGDLKYNRVR